MLGELTPMKKLVASAALVAAALVSTAAMAADPVSYDYPVYKDYVPPYVPPVDEGLKGSFYLHGSVGATPHGLPRSITQARRRRCFPSTGSVGDIALVSVPASRPATGCVSM